jgi:hypothetical protein
MFAYHDVPYSSCDDTTTSASGSSISSRVADYVYLRDFVQIVIICIRTLRQYIYITSLHHVVSLSPLAPLIAMSDAINFTIPKAESNERPHNDKENEDHGENGQPHHSMFTSHTRV